MKWHILLEPELQDFIKTYEHDDVHDLGLKKPPDSSWPYPLVLNQIKARQKARLKIPRWLEYQNIIFPVADVLEQASSHATARYKSTLVSGNHITDLTAGCGVDLWGFLHFGTFTCGTGIEVNQTTADILQHNIAVLTQNPVKVICAAAEDYISIMEKTECVYIDPQRRTLNRKGLFHLEDTAPNIIALLPDLKTKTQTVMIKTSPMLDIDKALTILPYTKQVHIIEWQAECREILYILNWSAPYSPGDIPITAVCLDDDGQSAHTLSFTRHEEQHASCEYAPPKSYLYEPGPAFQKSGGFKTLAGHYHLSKLHTHTHLYTSDTYIHDFPGRVFKIMGLYPIRRKALPLDKANLTIRNFPSSVEALRKKLKLRDGGEEYLFACTLEDESKVLIHSQKVDV